MYITNFTYLTFFCTVLMTSLIIIYVAKEKVKTSESKIYRALCLVNLISLILQFCNSQVSYFYDIISKVVADTIIKGYTFFLAYYAFVLLCYLIDLIYKNSGKILKTLVPIYTIVSLFIFVLPIELHMDYQNNVFYSFGMANNFGMIISAAISVAIVTIMVINQKKMRQKKAIPLIIYILLIIATFVLLKDSPVFFIIAYIECFNCFLMYFTIENPDVKMVNEYEKNKELVESTIEDKSNMIFRLSEDIKEPIRKINHMGEYIHESNDIKEMKKEAENISILSINTLNTIDSILNLSLMNVEESEDFTSYGTYELFNQIVYIAKSKIEGVDNFKYSISGTMPSKLRGDSTKIKEIITSIILYTYDRDKNGVIDLDISPIIKNNVCRTIITINHKGSYMSLQEINNRLESYVSYTETTGESTENFRTIKDSISAIGGTVLINSSEENGITYTIVIDQRIEESKESEKFRELTKYVSNKRRVIISDDNYKELEYIDKEYKMNNFSTTKTMFGKDVVEKINDGEVFDILVLNNSSNNYNAVKIVNEIGKEKLKGTKVIVLLDQNEERIKNRFLEDYPFDDYILKSNFKEELKRVIEKY